jgi:Replication protein
MQNSTQNYQSNKQYKYTAAERAYYRREKSLKVSSILEAAALDAGDEIAFVLAQRIKKCASPSNHFIAKDLNNKSGECFDGFGNLFPCGSKLCHSCMTKAAQRNKKIAEEALNLIKLQKKLYLPFDSTKKKVEKQRLRMITLTMPKVFLSCVESTELVIRAFDLFRKLKFTETYLDGYIKTIEFTVREDKTYHNHIHLLAACFFIPEKIIKRLWRRCVQTAFIEKGLDWRNATKNLEDADKLNVNLKLVDSIENSLKEVCKYLTKSESWENIPASHLLEVANIKRWRRMFELSGCFKKAAQWIKAKNEAIKEARREAANTESQNYLDTKCISAAENSSENPELGIKSLIKKESWRDRVKNLGVDAYLIILERQIEATQRVRKELLIEKYPLATFTDLAGFSWYEPDIDFIEGFAGETTIMKA